MAHGVFNWTFKDVVTFLKEHGFSQAGTQGSHYHFRATIGGTARLVQVPFHGQKPLKPRTLKSIIAQSGIPKSHWQ